MKRVVSLIIIFAVCISFAACTSSCGDTSTIGSSSAGAASGSSAETQGASSAESTSADTGSSNAAASSASDSSSPAGSGADSSETSSAQTSAGAQPTFAITAQPQNTSVATGSPLTLSVTASGSGTLSYRWYASVANNYNGIAMTGQTSRTVTLNTNTPFTQYYYCVITQQNTGLTLTTRIATASAVGSATGGSGSAPAPSDLPVITAQPLSAAYDAGATAAALSITANVPSNNGVLSYEWFKGTPASGSATSVATTATYTPPIATLGSENYYCVITNTLSSGITHTVTSTVAAIDVFPVVELFVMGVQINASNYTDVLGSGGSVSYNFATSTLTLNSANILYYNFTANDAAINSRLTNELTINLMGTSVVKTMFYNLGHAITATGALHITGAGTVTATGTSGGSGINANAITISGGTITANGGDSHGINSAGAITISGGTVTANGIGNNNHGINSAGAITISGGTVKATGANGSNNVGNYAGTNGGFGIRAYAPITILGGTVYAVGGNGGNYSGSLYAPGSGGEGIVAIASDIHIGTTTTAFSGELTAIGGLAGTGDINTSAPRNGIAFDRDASTKNFAGNMYYAIFDGATWSSAYPNSIGLASALSDAYDTHRGLRFAANNLLP